MMKAMTTIEFCEKSMKRTGYDASAYDRGAFGNLRAVVGDNPLLWLIPVAPPGGDGLTYHISEHTPLRHSFEDTASQTSSRDVEAARESGKMSQEKPAVQKPKSKRRSGAAGTGECGGSDVSAQESESGTEGTTGEEEKSTVKATVYQSA